MHLISDPEKIKPVDVATVVFTNGKVFSVVPGTFEVDDYEDIVMFDHVYGTRRQRTTVRYEFITALTVNVVAS